MKKKLSNDSGIYTWGKGGGGQPCPQNWELLCDKRFAS